MKFTFLGTGTSQGVPVIGCSCKVCQSSNPKDKRLRTSGYIFSDNTGIIIDIGPDFRAQMLNNGISKIHGVLLTHEHNDHVAGLDDIRPFNFKMATEMNIYGLGRVIDDVKKRYSYIFKDIPYPGSPRVNLVEIKNFESFAISKLPVQPLAVSHGNLPILGFRINNLTYITDAKSISPEEIDKIKGTKVLILNALRQKSHYSHLSLDEAIDLIRKIDPEKAFLTHISHQMGIHCEVERHLPRNIHLAYDGLTIELQ